MIVVSDTSPLNYLVLIGAQSILPTLFTRVLAPPAVLAELQSGDAPKEIFLWANQPPEWLEVISPNSVVAGRLGPGESEAISLAHEQKADVLLLDDRDGVREARARGLFVTGTLGMLFMASERKILDFRNAMVLLRQTSFRAPETLIEELLKYDARKRP